MITHTVSPRSDTLRPRVRATRQGTRAQPEPPPEKGLRLCPQSLTESLRTSQHCLSNQKPPSPRAQARGSPGQCGRPPRHQIKDQEKACLRVRLENEQKLVTGSSSSDHVIQGLLVSEPSFNHI